MHAWSATGRMPVVRGCTSDAVHACGAGTRRLRSSAGLHIAADAPARNSDSAAAARPLPSSCPNPLPMHKVKWRHMVTIRSLFCGWKGKVSPYSITARIGLRSWSRFLAVSLQVMWVINPAVGCHYFPPGLQLPQQPLRNNIQYCWWTEAQWVWTVCLRLLPDSSAAAIWNIGPFCA